MSSRAPRTPLAVLLLCSLLSVSAHVGAPLDPALAEARVLESVAAGRAAWVADRTAEVADFIRTQPHTLTNAEVEAVAETVVIEAQRRNLPVALVLAVIEVESTYRHEVVSHVGARGLMQLLPDTAAWIAKKNNLPWDGEDTLFDPVVNVRLGTAYLRYLADRFEDVPTAIAAYNAGPARILRYLKRGRNLPEDYSARVLGTFQVTAALTGDSGVAS